MYVQLVHYTGNHVKCSDLREPLQLWKTKGEVKSSLCFLDCSHCSFKTSIQHEQVAPPGTNCFVCEFPFQKASLTTGSLNEGYQTKKINKKLCVYICIHTHMYGTDHRSFSVFLETLHLEVSWLEQVLTDYESLGKIHQQVATPMENRKHNK